ncbi:hypothetical protein FRC11_001411 [Ceratobasidium sp. 423]|nr:hypothetical protein FRC11_001411 [Ceratobasidium sp. 423]
MSERSVYVPPFEYDARQGLPSPTPLMHGDYGATVGDSAQRPGDWDRHAPQGYYTAGTRDLSIGRGLEDAATFAGVSRLTRLTEPRAPSIDPPALPSSEYLRYPSDASSSPYGIRPTMPSFHAPLAYAPGDPRLAPIPVPPPVAPAPIRPLAGAASIGGNGEQGLLVDELSTRPSSVASSYFSVDSSPGHTEPPVPTLAAYSPLVPLPSLAPSMRSDHAAPAPQPQYYPPSVLPPAPTPALDPRYAPAAIPAPASVYGPTPPPARCPTYGPMPLPSYRPGHAAVPGFTPSRSTSSTLGPTSPPRSVDPRIRSQTHRPLAH